ncbi:hypothetical protein BCR39DRAFT_535738 [Naematelia encephala]|uniref:Uncharacterized protein n=1 Tax=Naematelia encephala TaxID=71784 RepID=A0A1Y2B007_9TREE|nr:hypothetical protein BCR39DRAFT_535738 [Naematelia encephala]
MYRLTLRQVTSQRLGIRTLSTTPSVLKSEPTKPVPTQGHATEKSQDSVHKDSDVQSASVRAGQDARSDSKKGSSSDSGAEEAPLDAARQGSSGGQSKQSPAQKEQADLGKSSKMQGSLKDQVGGQDGGEGVAYGGKEDAASPSIGGSVKQALGFDGLRKLRTEGKNFHTSARQLWPEAATHDPSPKDGTGAREPHEKGLKGDQNEHLKHSQPEQKDSGKGNAAAEPHLPSKQKTRAFSTSSLMRAATPPGGYSKALNPEPKETSGYDAPPEGLPSKLTSAYEESDPNAVQPAPDSWTPSSKVDFSSTAVDPPNATLAQQAKDGTLAERNGQPEPKFGETGNDEAWKHRK